MSRLLAQYGTSSSGGSQATGGGRGRGAGELADGRPSPASSTYSSLGRQQQQSGGLPPVVVGGGFFTPTSNFSYFPPGSSDEGSTPGHHRITTTTTTGGGNPGGGSSGALMMGHGPVAGSPGGNASLTSDGEEGVNGQQRLSLKRLTGAGGGGHTGSSAQAAGPTPRSVGCVACFGDWAGSGGKLGGFSPFRSLRRSLTKRRAAFGGRRSRSLDLLDPGHHGSSSSSMMQHHHPLHGGLQQGQDCGSSVGSTTSSTGARGARGPGMQQLSHRSSGSDSNSEFWDAVEMLDDTGLDLGWPDSQPSVGSLATRQPSSSSLLEGGAALLLEARGVIRIELLARKYEITVVEGRHGLIPVSFLLTETFRRYAAIKVFHDQQQQQQSIGGGPPPPPPRLPSESSSALLAGGEPWPQLDDVHRLIPACKGLVNKRTGEVFGLESQLTYEALLGDTYAVLVNLPTTNNNHRPSEGEAAAAAAGGRTSSSTSTTSTFEPGGLTNDPPSSSSLEELAGELLASPVAAAAASASRFHSYSGMLSSGSPLRVCKAVFPSTAVPPFPGADGNGGNCWSQPDATEFMVRGLRYMADKLKVPSEPAAYSLLGVDLLLSEHKRSHVSGEALSFVARARQNPATARTFLLVMNFSLPWGSFIAYFCPAHEGSSPYVGDSKLDALLKRFLEGDNEFRNQRLKVIPRCVEGPWPVKAAVGTTPAIMGTKILHTYHRQVDKNCFEIEVDISSSVAAQYILSVVKSFTSIVSVDLAFVLQGEDESELPERVLFAVRFHHLNVAKAPSYDHWQAQLLTQPPPPNTTSL